jgi:endonuclease/exonuclease/phosphatase family metal-dependent hydrolase
LNEYTPEKLAEDASKWGHQYTELLKTEGFPTGVTSRYPIEDVQRVFEGFHHGLLRVKIQDLYFYIIHLHPSNWETRNREIDWIISDINKLPEGSAVILAGDFNTFSPDDSVYYNHGRLEPFFAARDKDYNEVNLRNGRLDFTVIEKLLDYGLIDLENKMRSEDYQFTGSFPTLIEKEGEHGDQRRLDYIFTDGETATTVVHAEIIADDVALKLSDHLPMIVDFEFVK